VRALCAFSAKTDRVASGSGAGIAFTDLDIGILPFTLFKVEFPLLSRALLFSLIVGCLNITVPLLATPDDPHQESIEDSSAGANINSGEKKSSSRFSLQIIEAQVLLDRALFSPGEIDGVWGDNGKAALNMFQETRGLKITDHVDDETSRALMALIPRSAAPGLMSDEKDSYLAYYKITKQDVAGPYYDIPHEMAKQAELPEMGYRNITELLGERFHVKPETLETLNPETKWKAGDVIKVPNVYPSWIESKDAPGFGSDTQNSDSEKSRERKAKRQRGGPSEDEPLSSGLTKKPDGPVTITVSKQDGDLTVRNKDGEVIFFAPVTTGSEHDPLPLGEWKVNGTERYPGYHYNPDLFWDAHKDDKEAEIKAGPNNPVGVAWMDLSKPHYGLHGTPEPGKIGYTESHGCVRLTNWDALRLADMVKPGTKVYFIGEHQPKPADEGKAQ